MTSFRPFPDVKSLRSIFSTASAGWPLVVIAAVTMLSSCSREAPPTPPVSAHPVDPPPAPRLGEAPRLPQEQTLVSALIEYRTALEGKDIDRAVALTATFSKLPGEQIRERTQQFSNRVSAGGLKLWVYPSSAHEIEDCGVVLIGDQPFPDDPAYLLKQEGRWKILLGLTNWRREYFELSDTQTKAFEQLEEHHQITKQALRERNGSESEVK